MSYSWSTFAPDPFTHAARISYTCPAKRWFDMGINLAYEECDGYLLVRVEGERPN